MTGHDFLQGPFEKAELAIQQYQAAQVGAEPLILTWRQLPQCGKSNIDQGQAKFCCQRTHRGFQLQNLFVNTEVSHFLKQCQLLRPQTGLPFHYQAVNDRPGAGRLPGHITQLIGDTAQNIPGPVCVF